MFTHLKKNPNLLLIILLLAWTILNLFTAGFSEIIGDEAYYWFLAQNVEWGYFDHPPLFGLFNHIGVLLLGDTELGVRLINALLLPWSFYLFWLVIKTPQSTYKSVLRYFLILFSIPMLQVYGFVTTADGPLVMTIAVCIYAFKWFVDSSNEIKAKGFWLSILLLGASFALMGYAKYHGALVFIAIILSRPKLLLDWRFYIASLTALALFLPHLNWQYTHDFVSLKYHLIERNSSFEFGYIPEFLLNFFGVYNPFLTIPFIVILCKKSPLSVKEPMERLYRVMSVFLLLFFFYSTWRGHVQPQWMLPLSFPLIYFVWKKTEESPKFAKKITNSSIFMGLILVGVHLAIIIAKTPFTDKLEFWGNEKSLKEFSHKIEGSDMLITNGDYTRASKLNFYSPTTAYAYPSVYNRSNHYIFRDELNDFYNKPVAVEVSVFDTLREKSKFYQDSLIKVIDVPLTGELKYIIVDNYVPVRDVDISVLWLPEKVLINQQLAITLDITNPYNYDIRIGGNNGAYDVVMHIQGKPEENFYDIVVPLKETILKANSTISVNSSVIIPSCPTEMFKVGFMLQQYPFMAWYNSEVQNLFIVNRKDI